MNNALKYERRSLMEQDALIECVDYFKTNDIELIPFGMEHKPYKTKVPKTTNAERFAPDFLYFDKNGMNNYVEVKMSKAVDKEAWMMYKKWNQLGRLYLYIKDSNSKYGVHSYIQTFDRIEFMTVDTSEKPGEFSDNVWRVSSSSTGAAYASNKEYAVMRLNSLILLK